MNLIGLDIGTTGCKASLFAKDGCLLASASREYTVDLPRPGWAEQDPERVWSLAQAVLQEIVNVSGQTVIAAIGLSVQGEAITAVDANGRALRPMILGMDTRTAAQNEWLKEQWGERPLFERTGMPIHTINTLPKLLWLKEHEPVIWQKAYKFLLYEDFFIYKMTGQAVISRCLASRTQLYDIHQRQWSAEILDQLGLDAFRLSRVVDSGTAVAPMHREMALQLGLSNRPLIVTGGHDQACGALGAGLIEPGLAMVSTGTAEVVEVALDSPNLDESLFAGNISVYEHVVPGLFLAMTLNHSGGLLLRWFRDVFCAEEIALAQQTGGDAYDLVLQEACETPTSLLLLPHFAGSGTPTFDTQSRGAVLGLDFSTRKVDIAKAILEGLTFELRLNLDLLKAGGVHIDELRAIGGGARSPLWLQIKADITDIPVAVPQVTEAAGWGAALLAGLGAGVFVDVKTAVTQSVRFSHTYLPQSEQKQRYLEQYQLYRDVYPATQSIHHRLNGLEK